MHVVQRPHGRVNLSRVCMSWRVTSAHGLAGCLVAVAAGRMLNGNMLIDMCIGMRIDTCMDMFIDMRLVGYVPDRMSARAPRAGAC